MTLRNKKIYALIVTGLVILNCFGSIGAYATDEQGSLNTIFDLDFSEEWTDIAEVSLTDAASWNGSVSQSYQTASDDEIGQNVLEWTNKDFETANVISKMDIDFKDKVEIGSAPAVIDVSMKQSLRRNGPGLQFKVEDENGNAVNGAYASAFLAKMSSDEATGIYGVYDKDTNDDYKWEYIRNDGGSVYTNSELSSDYYIYRYIVYGDGTCRFLLKKDDSSTQWTEPFKNKKISFLKPGTGKAKYITGMFSRVFGAASADGTTVTTATETKERIKYIRISNEPLTVLSTTPTDGASYSQKDITVKFSASIDAESLSNGIEIRENGDEFTDYIAYVDSTDDSIVHIEFNKTPSVGGTYQIKFNSSLNAVNAGYLTFANGGEYRFSFNNELPLGKFEFYKDFTQGDDIDGITTGVIRGGAKVNDVFIDDSGGERSLAWRLAETSARANMLYMDIPLSESINPYDAETVIEFSAKMKGDRLPWEIMNFKGTDSSNNDVTTFFGINQWNQDSTNLLIIGHPEYMAGKGNGGIWAAAGIKASGSATANREEYNTFKYVINARDNTYRFFIKNSTAKDWYEPYAGVKLVANAKDTDPNSKMDLPANVSALRCIAKEMGFNLSKESTMNFKYIKVTQEVIPFVTNESEFGGDFDVSEPINLDFNCDIVSDTVNAENIKLFKVVNDEEKTVDESKYSVSYDSELKRINIILNERLDFSSKYKVVLNNIMANTMSQSVIKNDTEITFTTGKKYFLDGQEITRSGQDVAAKIKINAFAKYADNEKYCVFAVLKDSDGIIYDVKYISDTVVSGSDGKTYYDKTHSFTFSVADTEKKYKVMFVPVGSMVNSKIICTPVSVSE